MERGVNDLVDRFPRLAVPLDYTHTLAAWTCTLPPLRLGAHSLQPSAPMLLPCADGVRACAPALGASLWALPALHCAPQRATLHVDAQLATLDPSARAALAMPATEREALELPPRSPAFQVRVVLPLPRAAAAAAASSGAECPLDDLTLLLLGGPPAAAAPGLSLSLPGGAWDAGLDGGNPLLEDACLVRCAVRHCRASLGVNLAACQEWTKLALVHYQRSTGAEVVVVLLCLDPSAAALLYTASTPGGFWEERQGGSSSSSSSSSGSGSRSSSGGGAGALSMEAVAAMTHAELLDECVRRGISERKKVKKHLLLAMLHRALGFDSRRGGGSSSDSGGVEGSSAASSALSASGARGAGGAGASTAGEAMDAEATEEEEGEELLLQGAQQEAVEGRGTAAHASAPAADAPAPPTSPCLRVYPAAGAGATLHLAQLAGLLEYAVPTSSAAFELALTAECLWELIARDAAHILAAAFLQCGRGAAAAQDVGTVSSSSSSSAGEKRRAEGEAGSEDGEGREEKRPRGGGGEAPEALAPAGEALALSRRDVARAFAVFDRQGTGQLSAMDCEGLLSNGVPRLSRRAVADLVCKARGQAAAVLLTSVLEGMAAH